LGLYDRIKVKAAAFAAFAPYGSPMATVAGHSIIKSFRDTICMATGGVICETRLQYRRLAEKKKGNKKNNPPRQML
jgi:hypothetical protein